MTRAKSGLRLTPNPLYEATETERFLKKGVAMRNLLPAAGIIVAVTTLGSIVITPLPAKASANLAVCLQRGESTECDYTTYEQCEATASGIGADCIANPDPRVTQNSEPARPRRASRRR
jgi:Protein of unknown function (DUF3551)